MWRAPTLLEYYEYVTWLQQPTSLVMKVSLAAGLLLVAKDSGVLSRRLLSLVFATHFLGAAYLALGNGGGTVLVMLASLALVAATAPGGIGNTPPEWRITPEEQPWKAAAAVALVLLLVFPFWPFWPETAGTFRRLFFAPIGTLPHQSLGVLLLLIAMGGTRHRGVLAGTAILTALLIGLLDIFWAHQGIGALLAAGAIVTAFRVFPQELTGLVMSRGGEDTTGAREVRDTPREKRKTPQPDKAGERGRKWDL